MQECDPNHIALISAIENGEFDNASEILARDHENRYVRPVDALQVTALQMAAWKGNIDLLNQLYKRGADINSIDSIGRCALYYAAYNGNTDVTKWLLQCGADINIKTGIFSCTKDISYDVLEYFEENRRFIPHPYHDRLIRSCLIGRKLPKPMCWGRTPLHQAVINNHADVVSVLVEGGADVNVKDEFGITPLLLAGIEVNRDDLDEMTKFVKIVKILVDAKAKVNTTHPNTGNTVLHSAVMLRSAEATSFLIAKKHPWDDIFKGNEKGRTPLHIAAFIGNIETLTILLKAMPHAYIDIRDQNNCTALHIASYHDHRECVQALIRRGANLAAVTKSGVTAVDVIFDYISQPFDFLTDVLNSCVQKSNNYLSKKYEKINVNFGILTPEDQPQMAVVTAIIAAASNRRQQAILQHPIVETFIKLKWERLKIFFFLFILVHLFFVISLSINALKFAHNDDHVVTRRIVEICSCIILFHNTIQFILEPKYYVRQLETWWLPLICASLSLITSIAGEFVKCSKEEIKSGHCMDWVLLLFSIAIVLSWMQMMLLIGRVLMWGDYALMFYMVLKNILKVLFAFGCLIIGFALSFAVLFHKNDQFHNFWESIIKTVVMMTGEYEYEKLFDTKNDTSSILSNSSRIMFIVFILLVNIVLMNLMIGLVVNDIQSLEKEGHIRRLLKQAEFVTHLERVMSHRNFPSKWLHLRLKKLLRSRRDITTEIAMMPYFGKNFHYVEYRFFKEPAKIPAHLKEALFLLAKKSFKNF